MKKKIVALGLIIFLALSLFSPLMGLGEAQGVDVHSEIIGDSIYTEIGNKGLLIQTPHTITEWNGQVEVEFTSYFKQDVNLDFAFGFDTDYIRPTKVELWAYYLHPNSTPVYGEKWYNATVYNVTYIFPIPDQMYVDIGSPNAEKFYGVHILEENGTNTYKSVGFDTHIKVNDTCWKVFWSEDEIIGYEDSWYWDWKPINRAFKKVDIRNEPTWVPDLDKTWWIVTNTTFTQNQTKKARITIETTPQTGNHTYKYNVFIKRSEDTFREAFTKDRYVLLDPWILSNWQQKALLHIDNTGCTTAFVNSPVFFNVTYQDGMASDFIDLRFVNESTGTTLPHVVLDYAEGVNANCSFNVSYLQASAWDNTSYALYWDNVLATDVGNGSLVFPFFDNFSGTSIDTGKWEGNTGLTSVGGGLLNVSNAGGSADGINTIYDFAKEKRVVFNGEFRNGKFLIGWIDEGNVGTDRVVFYNGANPIDQYVSAIDDGDSQNTPSNWIINANMTIEVGWITGQARFIQAGSDETGSPITDENKIPDINLPVGLAFYDGGGCVFNYVYVCDWVDPAPTVSLGTVESQPAYIPPTPVITNNETGVWWVNYTWEAGHYGTEWVNNSAIANGSGDNIPANYSTPTIFQVNETWYRISGGGNASNYGAYWGWKWNGLSWENNTAIVNGLNNVTYANIGNNKPTAFYYNDNLYLINCILRNPVTEPKWVWIGYRWNGTSWINDSSIITGFTTHDPYYVYSSVFEMNGSLVAINTYGTNFTGWNYTGTTWQNDSNVVTGLYDINVSGGGNLAPSVFNQSNEYYLIYGNESGMFTGFKWDTNQWVYTPSSTLGLTDVGLYAYPDVFKMNSSWYLMSGEYNGTFIGYEWLTNATDSFNVTVWNETVTTHYNLTTNTSVNTTAGEGQWVNISIWAINTTGVNDSISISYAHRSTQLEEYGLEIWCFDETNGSMLNGWWGDINDVNKTATEYYNGYLVAEVPYSDEDYTLTVGCDGYETRTYYISVSEQTNTSVYLLGTGDGAYINFHVSDSYGYAMSEVYIQALVDGEPVEWGLTDSTGVARLFLSPTTQYTIILSKGGYDTITFTIVPTSSNYYFQMTTMTAPEIPTRTTTWDFSPKYTSIPNETVVFMLNASSLDGNIEYLHLMINNETHVIFNETQTNPYNDSIIAELDLSGYEEGDVIYVTMTLKEFGEEPLTMRASPTVPFYIYNGTLSPTSLYRIISDMGDNLGNFARQFVALTLSLLFAGIISKYTPNAYGGGILCLVFVGFFAVFGWVDLWLLILCGVLAVVVYAQMRGV